MTDQKKASDDQKDLSPVLDAARRRRMREAAERTRFFSDWSGQLGGMLSSCLDALEQTERERDVLRERLAAAERGA
jgi:hypothetical protein